MRIEVEARASREALPALLAKVTGVAGVELADGSRAGEARAFVIAKDGCDPREAIASALVAAGVGLRSMSVASATLEDVFLELVTQEE